MSAMGRPMGTAVGMASYLCLHLHVEVLEKIMKVLNALLQLQDFIPPRLNFI